MEFLSRSWSVSALEVSKALAPPKISLSNNKSTLGSGVNVNTNNNINGTIVEDVVGEIEENGNATVSGNPFSFASSETSQLIMERIMSQSFCRLNNQVAAQFKTTGFGGGFGGGGGAGAGGGGKTVGGKTVGRWLKDRKEKKKEETRAHNAQLHAAISVAGVAAAVAAIAAATAASSGAGKDEQMARTDMAVASAATLVAAQCVEAAEALGAEREHLASVVSSVVNVRSAGDITALTAAAATALRGAATLKARALKEVWNIAAVIPVEKGMGLGGSGSNGNSNGSFSGELVPEENFLGICSRELLARGCELLKRTRKGDLHWKIVSVYINRMGQVMLKMKSKHVAGTITKKKKNVVLEVCKDMPAWPGRHLLEGGEHRRYFGLKTAVRGIVEFECRNQREYDIWTQGVSRLLTVAAERNSGRRVC
ncbi:Pleckstrin-like, plant [Dillenia turbinata]|uniref:Pleckstrin-like, plant n=1 Tax=Dillenia turbinata TaxID=194707 RepID=A0AAN8YY93_9MAGN